MVAAFIGFGLLLYVVLWIVLPKGESTSHSRTWYGGGSPAIRIAEERFARGEISAAELQQIRQDLAGGA